MSPAFFTVCKSCSEVLPVTDRPPHPQQVALAISRAPLQATASRGRDAQNRRQYMLLLTASMHTARAMPSAMPCTHSLWTYTCRTLCAHQGPGSATCHRSFRSERAPPNKCRTIRVGFPRRRRRRRPRSAGCSSLSKFIKAVMELSAHPITYILRSSNIVSPNITLCHTCRDIPNQPCTGCGHLRPTACQRGHLRQKSRPGPKSGVGHRLTALIALMRWDMDPM